MTLTELKLPISVTAAVAVAALSAFVFLDERHVHASDFRSYQQSVEVRALERDKRQIEREVLVLELKCTPPRSCSQFDRAILKKNKEYLQEINADIRAARKK